MRYFDIVLSIIVVAGLARVCFAAEAKPGVNLSTPEAAVRSYAEAWRDGDGEKFLACYHASNANERELANATARWIVSSAKLTKAATAKFGETRAREIMQSLPMESPADHGRQLIENLDRKDDVEITVEGDRAKVGIEPVGLIELIKVNNAWKVHLGENAGETDEALQMMTIITGLQEKVAAGMEAGKYKTVEAAKKALNDE